MWLQNGLCVFFIIFIHTSNILFLGTEICIFTKENVILGRKYIAYTSIVDPCYLSSLSVICCIYKQRERSEFGMPLLHLIFQLLYAHIIILKIMSNIPEGNRRKSTHFHSAQIIYLLRFHINELRYTTVLAAFPDGLSSEQTIPYLYVQVHIIALLSTLPQNYYWQVSMKAN